MSEVTSALARTNGAGASSVRDRVADQLRAAIEELEQREMLVVAELSGIRAEKRDLEKSLQPLMHDPSMPAPKRGRGKVRPTPARVGPERLAEIEQVARELIREHGEVRQADVAKKTGYSSSVLTNAFMQLVEGGVLRLVRVQRGYGGGKFYGLTRPAERQEAQSTPGLIRPPKTATRDLIIAAIREHGRPATFAAIGKQSGVGDVAMRNAVHALVAEGVLRDAGTVPRADGKTAGKMPHAYEVVS